VSPTQMCPNRCVVDMNLFQRLESLLIHHHVLHVSFMNCSIFHLSHADLLHFHMQLCFSDDRFMAVIPPSSVSKMQTRLGLLYLADSGVRWVAEHSSNKTNPGATSQAKKSESWMSYFCRWEGARILQTCQESCNFGHGKRDLSN
jgi:hypothetical protein